MPPPTSRTDVIVLGAGVLGLASAAELGARDLSVRVVDPGGANASSIAAGMIAPAMESVLEGADPARAALLGRAAALWPDFAARHGIALHSDAAEWRGADPEGFLARSRALGFRGERTTNGVVVEGESRVEPAAALVALGRAPGVTPTLGRARRMARDGDLRLVETETGEILVAGALVIATGVAEPVEGTPEPARALIARVRPIRGQLLGASVPASNTIRADDGYIAPTGHGVLIGATMEPGARDLTPSAATAERQRAFAAALLGQAIEDGEACVGVRGASPDGLPMAGPVGAGLHLALAPRRNGWLLAPMVARAVAAGVLGEAAPEPALDPARFL